MREEIAKEKGGFEVFYRGYDNFCFTRSATGILQPIEIESGHLESRPLLGINFLAPQKKKDSLEKAMVAC